MHRVRSAARSLVITVAAIFAFVAVAAQRAAEGCAWLMAYALQWPAPTTPAAPATHQPQSALRHWREGPTSLSHLAGQQDGKGAVNLESPSTAPQLPQSLNVTVLASPLLVVVSRLGYLLLALCIVLGELQINLMRIPAVLGLPGGALPSLPLALTTALLFLSMAAFFGSLTLEFLEVVPHNTHLFPTLAPRLRRVFLVIAVTGLGLSVLCVGLLYAAGAALLEGTTLPALSILINLLQGILLTIIAVPAVWALVLGVLALVAIICAALWLVLTILSWLFHLLAGADSPPTSLTDATGNAVEDAGGLTNMLSTNVVSARSVRSPSPPLSRNQGVNASMPTYAPLHIVAAFGAVGRVWLPRVLTALDRLGGGTTIAAYGLCDPHRSTDDAPVDPLPALEAGDFSLLPEEIVTLAESNGHDPSGAHQLQAFAEKLKDVASPGDAFRPQLLALLGLNDLASAKPVLLHWKQRYPDLSITLFVVLPEPGHETTESAAGRTLLRQLHQEGVITVALILDPRSPLARQVGEDLEAQLASRLLGVMLLAHCHDAHNKTLADIARSLGSRGPFAALGIATTTVAPGKPRPGLVGWLGRRVRRGEYGRGDPADCLNRATTLARQLLHEEQHWTLGAAHDSECPPFVHAFLVPFRLRDHRFPQLAANLRTWQTATMPQASTPLVVSGAGGVQLQGSGYRCLVGCLYGLDATAVLPGDAVDGDDGDNGDDGTMGTRAKKLESR